jgi:hypothetical protein
LLAVVGAVAAVGGIAGVLCTVAPAATSASPTSPAAFTAVAALVVGAFAARGLTDTRLVATDRRLAARRLIAALPLLRTGSEVRTRCLGSLSTAAAFLLCGALRATRRGIAAVLPARSPVATRIARSVAPDIAIAVTVPTVAVAVAAAAIAVTVPTVSIAAAAGSITVVARIAMRRPMARRMS